MIRLDDVTKSFTEGGSVRTVLNGVSLEACTGEFVALQGASGSGKSTLLGIIAGLDLPDAGTVEVEGRMIHAMGERDRTLFRRKAIGFVFQFFSLIPTLTVAENVGLGLELNNRGAESGTRVADLLAGIGLSNRGSSYPDRLSGGEQQRVAIARAIAHQPAVVLADEPTGNLDGEAEANVLELLRHLNRDHGTTLLVATHSARAAGTADRVIRMDRLGR